MDGLADWWGLSLNQTLLVAAVILVVIDIFFATDIPTHIAYVLASVVLARMVEAPILVRILAGILAWFALVAFHYWVWRKLVGKFTNRFVAPEKYKSGLDRLIGATGTAKAIEQTRMVEIEGDLWPYEGAEGVASGTKVKVIAVHENKLVVEPLNGRS